MQGTTSKGTWSRRPLATLGKLTTAALIGSALGFATLLLTILLATGAFIMPLFIVAVALFIVAGIVATGVRWMPLFGALMGLGTFIGGVFTQQYFVYHLTHPAEGGPFIVSLLICVFAVIAICAGTGAAIQNYRSTDRQAPRWLLIPLAALGGLVLGALLVSLLVQATPVPSTATTVKAYPRCTWASATLTSQASPSPKAPGLCSLMMAHTFTY